ncbi:sensor domain-containing diguanylate cyclase [Aneurinibacillus tyrosinisolvens]|uniref:sensor domain-containing diguanylate cyclase n=1 Tax=Aneurinibacillus tyrosinisolvens TaxID=1443435 RepID=UPI00063F7535|nr:sensor domain-containing diguanylate cyclase [Aneurinibacillus tyrosinisolvens]
MRSDVPGAEQFHLHMIEKYERLLKQLEQEPFRESMFSALVDETEQADISRKDKRTHRNVIVQIQRIGERLEALNWMSEHLKILHDLEQTLTQTFDKNQIYEKAFELVSRVMDTDAFFIAFYKAGDKEIQIPFSIDNGVQYDGRTIPFGEGLTSEVLTTRKTVHINTEKESAEKTLSRWGNPEQDTNTLLFVPMLLKNEIKGVITTQSYREFAYKKEHEELLRIIGTQVASAVETAELYDKVYEMSIKDELTQIKNRRAFHRDVKEKLDQAEQRGQSLALIMLDSDNLKKVNDTYGHHVGDLLIRKVAESIRFCLVAGEEAYRYAGDEFMVIAPGLTLEEAEERANRIRNHLHAHPLILANGQAIAATLSIGIAGYPIHTKDPVELQQYADQSLYRSKDLGRNRITVYSHELFL